MRNPPVVEKFIQVNEGQNENLLERAIEICFGEITGKDMHLKAINIRRSSAKYIPSNSMKKIKENWKAYQEMSRTRKVKPIVTTAPKKLEVDTRKGEKYYKIQYNQTQNKLDLMRLGCYYVRSGNVEKGMRILKDLKAVARPANADYIRRLLEETLEFLPREHPFHVVAVEISEDLHLRSAMIYAYAAEYYYIIRRLGDSLRCTQYGEYYNSFTSSDEFDRVMCKFYLTNYINEGMVHTFSDDIELMYLRNEYVAFTSLVNAKIENLKEEPKSAKECLEFIRSLSHFGAYESIHDVIEILPPCHYLTCKKWFEFLYDTVRDPISGVALSQFWDPKEFVKVVPICLEKNPNYLNEMFYYLNDPGTAAIDLILVAEALYAVPSCKYDVALRLGFLYRKANRLDEAEKVYEDFGAQSKECRKMVMMNLDVIRFTKLIQKNNIQGIANILKSTSCGKKTKSWDSGPFTRMLGSLLKIANWMAADSETMKTAEKLYKIALHFDPQNKVAKESLTFVQLYNDMTF